MSGGLQGQKKRPSRELLLTVVLPLLQPLVRLCTRLRVNPLGIVALHGLCGLAAAVFLVLGPGWWPWAALLLLLRMLLDNLDGSVARASGQVTLAGRYFDTAVDLTGNAALFLALGLIGQPLLAALAFLLLTYLLSMDYNLERLYLKPRQGSDSEQQPAPEPGPQWILRPTQRLYRSVLAPQDRFIERLEQRRFRRLSGQPADSAPLDWQLAWFDRFSTASLVNLGLSTQSLLLILLILAGQPALYPLLVVLQALLVVLLQLWREHRFRNYLQVRLTGAG